MTAELLQNYLINQTNFGKLDSRAFEELGGNKSKNSNHQRSVPTLIQQRDMMGWNAKDITKHELIIEDKIVKGSVVVRTYRQKSLKEKILPVLFYIHGGGFFGGSIENVEQICRAFADKAALEVISIGYRLAPENPFPAGLLDCYSVVEYYATNAKKELVDSTNFSIAGDSAGGNLSLTTALLDCAYFKTNYLSKIVLYYPAVDLYAASNSDIYDTSEYVLEDENEAQMVHNYIKGFSNGGEVQVNVWYGGEKDRKNPLISPAYANDSDLKLLPPIQAIIGEFDPLRLQTDYFVAHLLELNHSVEYKIYNGMIHAFLDKVGDYPQAEQGIDDAIAFLTK